jgi:putative (di)nucleoside polyphosphate hydrolase
VTLSEDEFPQYRPCVGIMLLNDRGLAFIGRRIGMPAGLNPWQMPQGGIDPGESPVEAALRELREEVGTDKASLLAETRDWLHYDLPPGLVPGHWAGRYRGQRQKWFALRFTGSDDDIDIATAHPEFDAWRWVEAARLPDLIVPFKRQVYRAVLQEFRELLKA